MRDSNWRGGPLRRTYWRWGPLRQNMIGAIFPSRRRSESVGDSSRRRVGLDHDMRHPTLFGHGDEPAEIVDETARILVRVDR